ncbi:hypothetical protein [Streptomyces sp. NPDC089919]|uniref:hypothetical protein n=1 Tax=Streptomyces sp. NPDC089919 TaxID=3155188 RepID=UPI00343B720E
MTLATVLILLAVPVLVALLVLAPSVPARRNPLPGRRRRGGTRRLSRLPHQQGFGHNAR